MTFPSYFSHPERIDCAQLKTHAEELFSSGQFYCSEIVIKIIRDTFCPSISDEIIAIASGFPIGIGGGGCTCGAVSGGVMALGLIFGRTKPEEKVQSAKCMRYARELHDRFQKENKAICCRILTKNMLANSEEHKKQCAKLISEVVEIVTEIILGEEREQ
ncbi:MAG TPA: C-GCAxxG-C-C family protein [Methanocorpusculum sp.]|nr:C-GCAxxG-C-C family protein [Methanocorpusculum sp.]